MFGRGYGLGSFFLALVYTFTPFPYTSAEWVSFQAIRSLHILTGYISRWIHRQVVDSISPPRLQCPTNRRCAYQQTQRASPIEPKISTHFFDDVMLVCSPGSARRVYERLSYPYDHLCTLSISTTSCLVRLPPTFSIPSFLELFTRSHDSYDLHDTDGKIHITTVTEMDYGVMDYTKLIE